MQREEKKQPNTYQSLEGPYNRHNDIDNLFCNKININQLMQCTVACSIKLSLPHYVCNYIIVMSILNVFIIVDWTF